MEYKERRRGYKKDQGGKDLTSRVRDEKGFFHHKTKSRDQTVSFRF